MPFSANRRRFCSAIRSLTASTRLTTLTSRVGFLSSTGFMAPLISDLNRHDVQFTAGEDLQRAAVAGLTGEDRLGDGPARIAILAARDHRGLLDGELRARKPRVLGDNLETKSQALRHHRRELADFQIDAFHPRGAHIR